MHVSDVVCEHLNPSSIEKDEGLMNLCYVCILPKLNTYPQKLQKIIHKNFVRGKLYSKAWLFSNALMI